MPWSGRRLLRWAGQNSRSMRVWKTVTLKVHETLKGDQAKTLRFAERTLTDDTIYEGWRDAGREQLWFLMRNEPHEGEALSRGGRKVDALSPSPVRRRLVGDPARSTCARGATFSRRPPPSSQ